MYKVYIQVTDKGEIYNIHSHIFIKELNNWILIDEGVGERYLYAQNAYFGKPIINDNGIYRFLFVNGAIIERTDEEMAEELQKALENSAGENNGSSLEERVATLEESLTNYELAYYQGVNEA